MFINKIDKELIKPSVFGMFDGLTSMLGVVIPLLSNTHVLIFTTCIGLSISSSLSMGLGDYLSSDKSSTKKHRIESAIYMGLFTGIGCFLPVLPYAFVGGTMALVLSIFIYFLLTTCVAAMKASDMGWKDSILQTLVVSFVAIGIVIAATTGLPGSGE